MPKGDADNLRADLDDGYARVANLLLEGLCCAPLTAAEYSVVLFIIRRTYGWASSRKRQECKLDAMTAELIADGTAMPRSTVHKALQSLTRSSVIIREPAKAGNYYAFGMNTDLSQWGLATPEWKTCKQQLGDARDGNTYNRGGIEVRRRTSNRPRIEGGGDADGGVSPQTVRPITSNGETYNQQPPEVGALSPTDTEPEGTPTNSFTDSSTEKGGAGGEPPPPKETEEQIVIRELWTACGLEGLPTGKVNYGFLQKLIDKRGVDFMREWLEHLTTHPPSLPTGTVDGQWFQLLFKEAVMQPWGWRPRVVNSGDRQMTAEERRQAIARGEHVAD